MSRQKSTFGKLQRERDKQAKAKAKRERRQTTPDQDEGIDVNRDERARSEESAAVLLEMIAELQRQFDADQIGFDEYEQRKADLLGRLPID
jgi:hypothetical protein